MMLRNASSSTGAVRPHLSMSVTELVTSAVQKAVPGGPSSHNILQHSASWITCALCPIKRRMQQGHPSRYGHSGRDSTQTLPCTMHSSLEPSQLSVNQTVGSSATKGLHTVPTLTAGKHALSKLLAQLPIALSATYAQIIFPSPSMPTPSQN
jgi:hypothetical protein